LLHEVGRRAAGHRRDRDELQVDGDVALTWNVQGQPGPQGPAGPAGTSTASSTVASANLTLLKVDTLN
jgi:hypothetical protein